MVSLLEFSRSGVMDIAFFQLASCRMLMGDWEACRDGQMAGLRLRPLYIQEYFSVTITMYDPYMPDELMEAYAVVKMGTRLPHSFGCWSRRRRSPGSAFLPGSAFVLF